MKHLLSAAALLLVMSGAHAAPILTDNFDGNPVGSNSVPTGWAVEDGTVDIVGPGYYDLIPGNGHYVDLDGSSNSAGVLRTSLLLTAGVQYIATFQLAGNQRVSTDDTVDVAFGANLGAHTLSRDQGFTTYSISYTPDITGTYSLAFANRGGDNYGALLDNVSIAAVPEPESMALVMAGLACAGLALRRRRHG